MAVNIISLESFSRFRGMLETVDCFEVIPLLRDSQGNTIQMPFSSGHIKFLDDHFHRMFARRFVLDSCNLPAPRCLNSKTNQKHRYDYPGYGTQWAGTQLFACVKADVHYRSFPTVHWFIGAIIQHFCLTPSDPIQTVFLMSVSKLAACMLYSSNQAGDFVSQYLKLWL